MFISILLGLLAFVLGLFIVFIVDRTLTLPTDSSCTGDCNQGRNCTCANWGKFK